VLVIDPSHYLFWITSRAAGTTAMMFASASVGVGLAAGTKLLKGPDRFNIHQALAVATMVAIAVHGASLLGDTYLRPTLIDVILPFALSYKTIPTSIGIIAGWGMVILGLSYYVRRWIGVQRWKMIHRFTALAWAFGLVHTFTAGTDAGQLWFVALIVLTALPALVLLAMRLIRPRSPLVAAAAQR
jgi:methionine sulfoxide reductase heme-binding subunit